MLRKLFSRLACVALLSSVAVSFAGCGPAEVKIEDKSSETARTVSGKDQLKARLTEIATSGIGGSAVSGMRDGLAELKKTDESLANDLLKDLATLETLQETNAIKAMAGKMADKIK